MPPLPPPKKLNSGDEGSGPVGYLALVLAWAVPGLGHLLLGERARALIFGLTIHLLFAAGLLLGGLRSINPPEQPIWTYTQFLTGWPMIVAYRMERNLNSKTIQKMQPNGKLEFISPLEERIRRYESDRPREPERRKLYAQPRFLADPLLTNHPKVQDIGAVYCGIAGMLNLLVMFDVLLRITGSAREELGVRKPVASLSKDHPAAAGGAS